MQSKIKLKFTWTKYCDLSAAGNDNINDKDSDNIVFTIKDTKLYLSVITLSAKDNKKLSKLLGKGFERSVYWNEYKTNSENKNLTNEYRYFLKSKNIYDMHRYELVEESKKQFNRIFIDKKLAIKVIMDCRTTSAHKFRTRLGFKQYDVILTKEQLVLRKIINSFEGENMQTQYNVLSYRIDLYFHDYEIAIEIHENGHSNRNIDYEIKRQKVIEQELGYKFFRIDPVEEDLIFLQLSIKYLDILSNQLKL